MRLIKKTQQAMTVNHMKHGNDGSWVLDTIVLGLMYFIRKFFDCCIINLKLRNRLVSYGPITIRNL